MHKAPPDTGFSIHLQDDRLQLQTYAAEVYDNCVFETEKIQFLLEGVLLNKKQLLRKHAVSEFKTLIAELYAEKKELLLRDFEGEYRGFIFDRERQKLFVFTNITATQRIFFTETAAGIFIDTNLVRLSHILRQNKIQPQPNIQALYQLLCFTNLPETETPLLGVQKLLDGEYLEVDIRKSALRTKSYFKINEESRFDGSKEKALENLHEIFSEAIRLEYDKDLDYNTSHLALLSGGLDSRVAMMYATQQNYDIGKALCFSQSGYADHTISEKIARNLEIPYEFVPLDGGNFLKKIEDLTVLSEGMVLYTGGIHVHHAVEKLQYKNFSLFHSGQIGDGVLGGFNTEPRAKKPTAFKIVANPKFLPKVEASLQKILAKYETEEHFLLRNVAFNRTVLGAHVLQEKRYQTSPFMVKDFLTFALSLPEAWKFNHRLYLEWIAKYCPQATKYAWERTLLKPDAQWKTVFGDKVMKRGFRILFEKILQAPQHSSMYPYGYYYKMSPEIQRVYLNYFAENIDRLQDFPELQADVRQLLQSQNFEEKAQGIHILAIFKMFF